MENRDPRPDGKRRMFSIGGKVRWSSAKLYSGRHACFGFVMEAKAKEMELVHKVTKGLHNKREIVTVFL